MSSYDEINQLSKEKAAEAAQAMRESARMVRVFEPTKVDIDDAKRTAWNRTVIKIKEIYGLDSAILHPHRSLDEYSVTSGDYIEGPVYIGNSAFQVGSRLHISDDDEPGLNYGTDTLVPYIYPRGEYGQPVSRVYDAIADALEEYVANGVLHKDALGEPQEIPDSLEDGLASVNSEAKSRTSWWKRLLGV